MFDSYEAWISTKVPSSRRWVWAARLQVNHQVCRGLSVPHRGSLGVRGAQREQPMQAVVSRPCFPDLSRALHKTICCWAASAPAVLCGTSRQEEVLRRFFRLSSGAEVHGRCSGQPEAVGHAAAASCSALLVTAGSTKCPSSFLTSVGCYVHQQALPHPQQNAVHASSPAKHAHLSQAAGPMVQVLACLAWPSFSSPA